MIKKTFTICSALVLLSTGFLWSCDSSIDTADQAASGEYTLIIEGFDWGPAVSKVILPLQREVAKVDKTAYRVTAKRSTDLAKLSGPSANGGRNVIHAYISDDRGNPIQSGKHITLVLEVGPNLPLASPIQYLRVDGRGLNKWIKYELVVESTTSKEVWTEEADRILPLIDEFDLSGKYIHQKKQKLSFAAFQPQNKKGKSPLIIWLHGGGEGGTDPTIPLIANRAANYAAPEIQVIFGGAYVLVPQSPTFWMQNASGEYTTGKENDIYNESLMALIQDYVDAHPGIDKDRIYVGGCSNGGYMSLKLILEYPDYFAAGYISALAYQAKYIKDEQIQRIKNVPIWFIHSKDDPVTVADETVVPLYHRLVAAGSTNVHFSFYDHVVDLTGVFGGTGFHYSGHWSWIYSHTNHARLGFDGKPVIVDGKAVNVMDWMAAQSR